MSGSRNSKLSAFQVLSSVRKVSPDKSKKQGMEASHSKGRSNSKTLKDMPRQSTSTIVPKSLITMVKESDDKKPKLLITSKRNSKSSQKQAKDGNTSVKSLLDLSFDNPGRVDFSQNPRVSSQRGTLIRRTAGVKRRSLPHPVNVDKQPLIREDGISSSSKLKPLVVEMQTKDDITRPSPKPLLALTAVSLPKKPVSLLDLPQSRLRKTLSESSFIRSRVQFAPTLSDSRKRKIENETVKSGGNEVDPDFERSLASDKKARFELSQKAKSIQLCQGKNCSYLIISASCPWLHMHGKARICVEKGTVSIMAFTLQANVTYEVFSPAAGCLLAIHVEDMNRIAASDVKAMMSKLCGQDVADKLSDLQDNTIAILKVKELKSRVCDYLTSFIPFTHLFKIVSAREHEKSDVTGVTLADLGVKVAPEQEMTHTCMSWSPDYNEALEKWSRKVSLHTADGQGPILLTCGGKNSGKSILNRCAVNVTLQSVDEVAYLDCDVGQTEFSPPATLSLHILKKPVLGPPFCHQNPAEEMVFYGDISPSQDPGFYVRCLHFVFQAYASIAAKKYLPLIVNTMGFPEGIGLKIFIDTMHIVKPDLVIQIESAMHYANFPAITQEMVALEEGWTFNKCPPDDPGEKVAQTKAHELIFLSSLASPKRDFSMKLQPMDLRNLALLSSISMNLERDMTLMSVTPFAVPYKHLAVHVCHNNLSSREILVALDASVVALCVADLSKATKKEDDLPWLFQEMPICHCVGLGFVRAVDMVKGVFLVVTTLPRAMLCKVNAVLKGSIALPDQFFLNQKSDKSLPYVDALAPSTAVAAVRPRTRMPRVTLSKAI